jgi:hypothetical protein
MTSRQFRYRNAPIGEREDWIEPAPSLLRGAESEARSSPPGRAGEAETGGGGALVAAAGSYAGSRLSVTESSSAPLNAR